MSATIYKTRVQIADMDNGRYAEGTLSLAFASDAPAELVMAGLLVRALHALDDAERGPLEARSPGNERAAPRAAAAAADGPLLWRPVAPNTEAISLWIDVGQPDAAHIRRASGLASEVAIYNYAASARQWWKRVAAQLPPGTRNVQAWTLDPDQLEAWAVTAAPVMAWQFLKFDDTVRISDGLRSYTVAVTPLPPLP